MFGVNWGENEVPFGDKWSC